MKRGKTVSRGKGDALPPRDPWKRRGAGPGPARLQRVLRSPLAPPHAPTEKVCRFDEARTIVSPGSPSAYLFRNPRGVSR